MGGFCPDEWHGTTDEDIFQMSLGDEFWLLGGESLVFERGYKPTYVPSELERKQKIITDKAHAMAERLGLIPYTEETFLKLMDEVERQQ